MRTLDDNEDAERSFCKAIDIARQEVIKSCEHRAAIPLARLWCDQGKTKEAHDLLFPVYDWFREGSDTTNLQNAKALLEELAH